MPEGSISATHVWKRFRADRDRGMMKDELAYLRARLRGEITGGRRWRWALRDVDLVVEPGASVGLIGVNGSGKSTLLKVLTRVMYPYAGDIELSGRVGALIEVVSGIHHELTGRENLYLYGSLMGLPRSTVRERFDEMVSFAELEAAIDRQVKFYSLGMQMRLGFAVAAFLDAHILLVDEVLAVGDAAFQQKCLERMRQALADGTTLVLVSHDLPAIEATCDRVVWLERGSVKVDAPTRDALRGYRQAIEEASTWDPEEFGSTVRVLKVEASAVDGGSPRTQEPLATRVVLETELDQHVVVGIGVSEGPATPVWVVRRDVHLQPGETQIDCEVARMPLPRGRYYLWMCVFEPHGTDIIPWHPAAHFDVYGPELDPAPLAVVRTAPVHVETRWDVERL